MNLDDYQSYPQLDKENILQNIEEFPEQIQQAWAEIKRLAIPTHYVQAHNICLLGIGGSAMGADLVRTFALPRTKLPIVVLRDYNIPDFVSSKTLVIGISYSGNTEETLSSFEQSAKRGAKLVAMATGGQLESLAQKYKAPFYRITYGAQPRAALGFTLTAQLGILAKFSFVELKDDHIAEAVQLTKQIQAKIKAEVPESQNFAKQIARKLHHKIPLIYGSGLLQEVARRYKGQFNENAKTTSFYEQLPELSHNSLVGLEFPKKLSSMIFVLVLQSRYDHPRNKIRQAITMQILERRAIAFDSLMIEPTGEPLSEMLQMIVLGDYISYYLSLLNEVDPTPVEIITYLKKQLAEQRNDYGDHR